MNHKIENENGEEIQFVPKRFVPLDFRDLKLAVEKQKLFKFKIFSYEIYSINEGLQNKLVENIVTAKFNFSESIPIYALIQDGWLPMPFINPRNFLVDSNVIIFLEKIVAGKVLNDSVEVKYWLEMVKDKEAVFNPLPFAFEGNNKAFPTLQEFKDLYQDATKTINNHLSDVQVISHSDATFAKVHIFLRQVIQRYDPVNDFLMAAVPLILHHKSDVQKPSVQNQIFEAAKHFGLSFISFPVLTVLSCLYEQNTKDYYQAARKVLKPSVSYTSDATYNM